MTLLPDTLLIAFSLPSGFQSSENPFQQDLLLSRKWVLQYNCGLAHLEDTCSNSEQTWQRRINHLDKPWQLKWQGIIRASCKYWQLHDNACSKHVWTHPEFCDRFLLSWKQRSNLTQSHLTLRQQPCNFTPEGWLHSWHNSLPAHSNFVSGYPISNEFIKATLNFCAEMHQELLEEKRKNSSSWITSSTNFSFINSFTGNQQQILPQGIQEAEVGFVKKLWLRRTALKLCSSTAPLFSIWHHRLSLAPLHCLWPGRRVHVTNPAKKSSLFGWGRFLVAASWISLLQGQTSSRAAKSGTFWWQHGISSAQAALCYFMLAQVGGMEAQPCCSAKHIYFLIIIFFN